MRSQAARPGIPLSRKSAPQRRGRTNIARRRPIFQAFQFATQFRVVHRWRRELPGRCRDQDRSWLARKLRRFAIFNDRRCPRADLTTPTRQGQVVMMHSDAPRGGYLSYEAKLTSCYTLSFHGSAGRWVSRAPFGCLDLLTRGQI